MSRILVIEDEELLRRTLRFSLTQMGHTVVEAGGGREGLALQGCAPADLVLTDIVMPEMDGLETILKLRRLDPGLKIVAMSGGGLLDGNEYLAFATKMGAARVLAKPFSIQALQAAIDGALGPESQRKLALTASSGDCARGSAESQGKRFG